MTKDHVSKHETDDIQVTHEKRERFADALTKAGGAKALGREIAPEDLIGPPPPLKENLSDAAQPGHTEGTAETHMDELYDADLEELLDARGYEYLRARARQLEARRRAERIKKARP